MTLDGDPQYPPPYPWPPAPPRPPARPRPPVAHPALGWALVGLGVLIVVGSTAPWVSIDIGSGTSADGTDGDGAATLGFGVVVAVVGLAVAFRAGRSWVCAVAGVFAFVTALTALLDIGHLNGDRPLDDPNLAPDEVSVGWGLWTVLVAGVLATAVAGLGARRRR